MPATPSTWAGWSRRRTRCPPGTPATSSKPPARKPSPNNGLDNGDIHRFLGNGECPHLCGDDLLALGRDVFHQRLERLGGVAVALLGILGHQPFEEALMTREALG